MATIAALSHEDCGPCLQLNLKMAREAGVDQQVLEGLVKRCSERGVGVDSGSSGGDVGAALYLNGHLESWFQFVLNQQGLAKAIDAIRNPDKLASVAKQIEHLCEKT